MKKHFATILIGATYFALGYASTHEDCLMLGQTQTIGDEFHACLHPVNAACAGQSETQTELGRLMRQYGVWTDNGFDLLKAAPVAHEYASRKIADGLQILLDAQILSVTEHAGGCAVEYLCNEGVCRVTAERVLDTTVSRVTAPHLARCTGKTLNVFTVCSASGFGEALISVCPQCRVTDGFSENEKLVLFPVETDEDIRDAYRRIINIWKAAFPSGDEKILFMAEEFDAVYEADGQGGVPWLGERFEHPVTAFLKGRNQA